ncbi:hypothetical protein [Cohnella sp. AR92]|uniref:hypothetical protein n=1 Tax=Cohnella sp. AR92 TaxID=648716 RepID=UPI000F8F05DE|nr:hypothetical protein [Cohnella sp. AR92]RUS45313.1 hypothetical protein ELR57_20620 [Cohnella sp. AR92]
MGSPMSVPAAILALFLIFWTGSSWFVALHPKLFRRVFRRAADERGGLAFVRAAAIVYGIAGFILLLLPNL